MRSEKYKLKEENTTGVAVAGTADPSDDPSTPKAKFLGMLRRLREKKKRVKK